MMLDKECVDTHANTRYNLANVTHWKYKRKDF